jgi:hypothetical protein
MLDAWSVLFLSAAAAVGCKRRFCSSVVVTLEGVSDFVADQRCEGLALRYHWWDDLAECRKAGS